MKLRTHIMIAKKVHEHLEKKHGININKRSFILGNIFPDFIRRMGSLHHTMEDSLDYVLKRINNHKRGTLFPSFHLGKTNHYLSDFFCSVHHKSHLKLKFKDHLKYEDKLHDTFMQMHEESRLSNMRLSLMHMPLGDFKDIIGDLETEYLKHPKSIETDIVFAIWAPLTACKYLLSGSVTEFGDTAAQVA